MHLKGHIVSGKIGQRKERAMYRYQVIIRWRVGGGGLLLIGALQQASLAEVALSSAFSVCGNQNWSSRSSEDAVVESNHLID